MTNIVISKIETSLRVKPDCKCIIQSQAHFNFSYKNDIPHEVRLMPSLTMPFRLHETSNGLLKPGHLRSLRLGHPVPYAPWLSTSTTRLHAHFCFYRITRQLRAVFLFSIWLVLAKNSKNQFFLRDINLSILLSRKRRASRAVLGAGRFFSFFAYFAQPKRCVERQRTGKRVTIYRHNVQITVALWIHIY